MKRSEQTRRRERGTAAAVAEIVAEVKSRPRRKAAPPHKAALLSNHVVAYLDLLGFRAEMMRASKMRVTEANAALARFRDDILPALVDIDSAGENEPHSPLWQLRAFTDNFVLGMPFYSIHDAEGALGTVGTLIARLQMRLARAGRFIRGGLAAGLFHMDRWTVFGQALVEAYQVESEIARDPRVAFSPVCAQMARDQTQYYSEPADAPQNQYFATDADGQVFINYLYSTIDGDNDLAALRDHKEAVVAKLNEYAEVPPLWAKYRWVADYHNFFCRRWLPRHYALRIPANLMSNHPTPLVGR